MIIHPFEPFYNTDSKILILGSFPSVKSRENNFYYGHIRNRFWKVLARVFCDVEPKTLPQKKAFLKKHKIALFDVIKSCEIEKSSDLSIKNVTVNDLEPILTGSQIKAIFVNGKTALKYYEKYIENDINIKAVLLPSTSPANAAYSLDALYKCWNNEIKKTSES